MSTSSIHSIEAVLLLLLVFVAGFAGLAQRLKIPYPIVLVGAGLVIGFVTGIPRISLDPLDLPRRSSAAPVCGGIGHLVARLRRNLPQHRLSGDWFSGIHGVCGGGRRTVVL